METVSIDPAVVQKWETTGQHVAKGLRETFPSHVDDRFNRARLLLDSRVVDLTMSYNPIFVTVSSLKPLFFNSLKNELRFLDNMEG